MHPALVWLVTLLLIGGGIAGAVLPGLPGAPLILVAAAWHELFRPQDLSWPTISALAVLAAASFVMELALAAAGGRYFGGGRWAAAGAALGSFIGFFFGPLGLVIGAVAGAALAEARLGGRRVPQALKAGVGAGAGLIASTAAKLAVALLMAALFLLDCLAW